MRLERNVMIEISGRCNARCPWCTTGRATREGRPVRGGFMDPGLLDAVLQRLEDMGLVLDTFRFELFNWGEPLLHPRLPDIVEVMNRRGLRYRLSTNASLVPDLSGVSMHGLDELVVSMPGFSQQSYDAIHGFGFERILDNIRELRAGLTRNGFRGRAFVSLHVYRFNVHEVVDAARYCRDTGMAFHPYMATPNDHPTCMDLLSGRLDGPRRDLAERHLLLSHLPGMLARRPPDWRCWQQNKVVLDEEARFLTCCLLPREHPDYSLGSVFDLDLSRALEAKRTRPACRPCLASGTAYWLLNPVAATCGPSAPATA